MPKHRYWLNIYSETHTLDDHLTQKFLIIFRLNLYPVFLQLHTPIGGSWAVYSWPSWTLELLYNRTKLLRRLLLYKFFVAKGYSNSKPFNYLIWLWTVNEVKLFIFEDLCRVFFWELQKLKFLLKVFLVRVVEEYSQSQCDQMVNSKY